jgi:hypothetical protein
MHHKMECCSSLKCPMKRWSIPFGRIAVRGWMISGLLLIRKGGAKAFQGRQLIQQKVAGTTGKGTLC